MMTDINILIDKCEQLTKKIREEEESNLEVAKLKKQSIRLQDRYKEGW